LSICCFLLINPNFVLANTVSVQDIIDGIVARRLKTYDVEVQYVITDENQDAFYDKIETRYEKQKANAPEGQRVERSVPVGKSFEKLSSNAYLLFSKNNKRAFETYSISDGVRTLYSKAAYDGEIFKYVNVPQLNGSVERRLPENVIPFPTIPKICGIEGNDLDDYLSQPNIEVIIHNEAFNGDDLLVELSTRRSKVLSPQMPHIFITEHRIWINVSKDFWPTKIQKYNELADTTTGDSVRRLMEETKFAAFTESNGVYYPTSIVKNEFDYDFSYTKPRSLPIVSDAKLMTSRTVTIEKISINSDLPDEVFDFTFPNGTRYHDAIIDMGMIVGADPDKLAQYMAESAEALAVLDYTKEEAMAILAKRQEGKPEEAEALRSEYDKKRQRKHAKPQIRVHPLEDSSKDEKDTELHQESTTLIICPEKPPKSIRQVLLSAFKYIALSFTCIAIGYWLSILIKRRKTG